MVNVKIQSSEWNRRISPDDAQLNSTHCRYSEVKLEIRPGCLRRIFHISLNKKKTARWQPRVNFANSECEESTRLRVSAFEILHRIFCIFRSKRCDMSRYALYHATIKWIMKFVWILASVCSLGLFFFAPVFFEKQKTHSTMQRWLCLAENRKQCVTLVTDLASIWSASHVSASNLRESSSRQWSCCSGGARRAHVFHHFRDKWKGAGASPPVRASTDEVYRPQRRRRGWRLPFIATRRETARRPFCATWRASRDSTVNGVGLLSSVLHVCLPVRLFTTQSIIRGRSVLHHQLQDSFLDFRCRFVEEANSGRRQRGSSDCAASDRRIGNHRIKCCVIFFRNLCR